MLWYSEAIFTALLCSGGGERFYIPHEPILAYNLFSKVETRGRSREWISTFLLFLLNFELPFFLGALLWYFEEKFPTLPLLPTRIKGGGRRREEEKKEDKEDKEEKEEKEEEGEEPEDEEKEMW